MKRKQFTEEQIIGILKESEAGANKKRFPSSPGMYAVAPKFVPCAFRTVNRRRGASSRASSDENSGARAGAGV